MELKGDRGNSVHPALLKRLFQYSIPLGVGIPSARLSFILENLDKTSEVSSLDSEVGDSEVGDEGPELSSLDSEVGEEGPDDWLLVWSCKAIFSCAITCSIDGRCARFPLRHLITMSVNSRRDFFPMVSAILWSAIPCRFLSSFSFCFAHGARPTSFHGYCVPVAL
jgi:hypothetical protein